MAGRPIASFIEPLIVGIVVANNRRKKHLLYEKYPRDDLKRNRRKPQTHKS